MRAALAPERNSSCDARRFGKGCRCYAKGNVHHHDDTNLDDAGLESGRIEWVYFDR
jgi:hypothetical protein